MEQRVSFISRGHTVRGWKYVPERPGPFPAIVLCHGLTGNCSEHGLFERFGQAACEAGFAVLRMDCVGSGESGGSFEEATCLSGWRDDLLAGLEYLSALPEVDGGRMAALGISMGAAAAMLTLADDRVRAAAGWAPAVFTKEVFSKISGESNWARLKNGEHAACEYAGVSFRLAPRFAEDCEKAEIMELVRRQGKPVLLSLGSDDPVIDPAFGERIASLALPNVEFHMVEGEDHGFLQHGEENIQTAISFFKRCLMEEES